MSDFTLRLEAEIPRLRRYGRALTGTAALADDLVQSCLMRALANQHRWEPGSDLRAWLFTILHNLHVSEIRKSVRDQHKCAAVAAVPPVQRDSTAILDLIDVERAIAKLPDRQRQVLLLIGLEDMSYDEAASILGLQVGTVRSRLGRARAALRRLVGREITPATSDASSPAPLPTPLRSRADNPRTEIEFR
jgi:RNA polymerase sigma-70 factor, ECF subfamily